MKNDTNPHADSIAEYIKPNPFEFPRAKFRLDGERNQPGKRPARITPQSLADENKRRTSDWAKEQKHLEQSLSKIESELLGDKEKSGTYVGNKLVGELESLKDLGLDILSPGDLASKQVEKAILQNKLKSAVKLQQRFERKAKFWRQYIGDPEAQKTEFFEKFFGNTEVFQHICELAEFDEDAVKRLGEMTNIILSQLIHLVGIGSKQAAKELASIAIFATQNINYHAAQKKTTFRSIAKGYLEWPLMTSRKREKTFPQPYGKRFLKNIELAEGSVFKNFNASNWKISDDAGKVAWQLWRYINDLRQMVSYYMSKNENEAWFSFSELEIQAGGLEQFSPTSYGDWWELAKNVLLESYPKPFEVSALKKIGAPRKPELRRTAGVIGRPDERERLFFEALRGKFKSFSGANRRR